MLEQERDRDDAAAADDVLTIRRVLAGDREAFGALVARYGRRVHDLARRMLRDADEAEDAVQQTFLNAFRALDRFDPHRPFRHWLLRISSNLCRNRLVARRRRPIPFGVVADDESLAFEPVAPPPRPPTDPVDSDRVRAALDALPETYREAAVLRYVHGLDLAAIADVTGDPVATVKTHLHRARGALHALLAPPADRTAPETRPGRAGTDA